MEESAAWGAGYDVGQAGILQAVATAELLATKRERDRIIKLLMADTELLDNQKGISNDLVGGVFRAIALIKGESK
jgi:hypothetical protein